MTKALKKKERIDPEDKDYKEVFKKLKELITRVASAQFPEALNFSTSPETPRTSGLDRSQFRKHVGISDLMGVNSGNTSDLRT